ncbi:caspase domain-containing protein [Russula compacta]|nr:caspase domain-containing protein [Russula compacta]
MAAAFSEPSCIPRYSRYPNSRLPNFKLLAIGINYETGPSDSGLSGPCLQLKGPVRDARDFKETLMDYSMVTTAEVYHYREQDICLMTDEEVNKNTDLWPSRVNILRAIDSLVRGASPEDVFVFYYAGHCGLEESVNGEGDEEERPYIITCDNEKIFGDTLRKHLVARIPIGSRLTAILDACHSGALLALDHHQNHCFPRARSQTVSVIRNMPMEPLRRQTEPAGQLWVVHSTIFLLRRNLSTVVTTTLAIIRLKSRLAKRHKEGRNEATPPTPTAQPPCDCHHRADDLLTAPEVICLTACAKNQRTWEDSKKKGKGMTVKLIKILRKNPAIKLGDLDKQLQNCLSKLAFKRVRKALVVFRILGEKVTPNRKERLESKYRKQGLFDYNDQTAQIESLLPLRPDDQLLFKRIRKADQPD